jgi:oligopeptide transport system ATP-binding protein
MMQSNNEILLRVEHLCQYFKIEGSELKAVDDVNFEVKKGEVFGLVGESGCGKTTTGRAIIRLCDITSGNIYFKGIRIAAGRRSYMNSIYTAKASYKEKLAAVKDKSEKKLLKTELFNTVNENKKNIRKADYECKNCDKKYSEELIKNLDEKYRPLIEAAVGEERPKLTEEYNKELYKAKHTKLVTRIQMIFQDPVASLDPRMTVREIIAEGLIIQGEHDRKVIDEKVCEMLELVGLVCEHADRYPHEFSGGQRQRIGVARAIIMNPDLIIADEPVSALDVSIQAQVINLLNDLRQRFGLTIIFIAHDLSVVKYFSDRIGVMYFGKMVELASSDELFKNPLHPYTRSLLSAIPLPDPIYEKTHRRIVYNPLADHDYTTDKPVFREVLSGHYVQCNDAEFEKYKKVVLN